MESGLCPKRLKNVDAYLQRIVDEGAVAGVGGMIIRRDTQAYCASFGLQDIKNKIPMQNDSIYRIYSMTKTFTVVAALTLYEKGLFKLDDPIADYIPAFNDTKVAEKHLTDEVRLVPPKRPLTIEHLFTMTSGIPYSSNEHFSGLEMAKKASEAAKAAAVGKPWNTERMINEAAKVPLCFHPGDKWLYGFSHDILGRLIEVVSGKKLGTYFKEIIFDPLGMVDTAFFVPQEKQARVAKSYQYNNKNALTLITDLPDDPASPSPPAFEAGGMGCCSTMADYALFAQMLLHKGKIGDPNDSNGDRILSRKTVDLIRMNHVDASKFEPWAFPHMKGYGYGLGVRTMLNSAKAGLSNSVGEWGWDGMFGTYYLIDPIEDMTALFFIQLSSGINHHLHHSFAQTVYSAIAD